MPAGDTIVGAKSLAAADRPDRILGAAVHVSSIFWPLLGPLVGWLVFRKSRPFVSAHGLQALKETILLTVLLFFALVASTTYTVIRIVHYVQTGWVDFSWQEFLVRFLVGWILLALLELANTVVSVGQAWGALRGNWPRHSARASKG